LIFFILIFSLFQNCPFFESPLFSLPLEFLSFIVLLHSWFSSPDLLHRSSSRFLLFAYFSSPCLLLPLLHRPSLLSFHSFRFLPLRLLFFYRLLLLFSSFFLKGKQELCMYFFSFFKALIFFLILMYVFWCLKLVREFNHYLFLIFSKNRSYLLSIEIKATICSSSNLLFVLLFVPHIF